VITIKKLKKWKACKEGVDWFKLQEETNEIKVVEKLMGANKFDWANWLISRVLKRRGKIEYALFSAELVLPMFESQ